MWEEEEREENNVRVLKTKTSFHLFSLLIFMSPPFLDFILLNISLVSSRSSLIQYREDFGFYSLDS